MRMGNKKKKKGVAPRRLPYSSVRSELLRQGAFLG